MNCPVETNENAEILLDYCVRKLDAETQAVLERHMQVCPACRRFQEGQQMVWSALDAWEPTPVSRHFDRHLYERIERESRRSLWGRLVQPLRPMIARPALTVAAMGLVMIAAFLVERQPRALPALQQNAQTEGVDAEQVERTLDDLEMLRQFSFGKPETAASQSM